MKEYDDMAISHTHLIWANKPGCSRPVAEFWIEESYLWFTVFVDDADKTLKIEVFPWRPKTPSQVIDFAEVERVIESAKRELLVLAASQTQ